jgi:hypothetical protein
VKKLKGTFPKIKLLRIFICMLMIATILQVGAISLVQATDGVVERPESTPLSPDNTVVVSSNDANLISTEEEVVVMPEGGKIVSPAPDNITTKEEIENTTPVDDTTIGLPEKTNRKTAPKDDTTIGLPEDANEEYQSLIAPNPTTATETPLLGAAALLVAVGAIATAFIVIGYKKTK